MSYFEDLRTEIVQAFNWEAGRTGQHTNTLRILLHTGEWVDGGLKENNAATFTIEISKNSDGEYRQLEIPYHAVAALERRSDR